MHSLDLQVLSTLQRWVEQDIPSWLCTIVATQVSSPRPAGSLMACNLRGQVVGSLSGGCVEDDLLEKLLNGTYGHFPKTVEYGVSAEENARLGLPCGGYLTVLVEHISQTNLSEIQCINQALLERTCIQRTINLENGQMSLKPAHRFSPIIFNEQSFVQVYGPRFTLLLVGAGQIASCLAQMASDSKYAV